MNEELEKALDIFKKQVKGKTSEEVKSAIESLEVKYKDELAKEVKSVKEDFEVQLKAIQDHADKLDIKLQNNSKNVATKSFSEQVLDLLAQKKADLETLKNTKSDSGLGFNVKMFDTKAAGTMTVGANYTGGTVGITSLEPGLTRIQRRNPFLREIVTIRPVSSNLVSWAEQANADPGVAGTTDEGAAKTQTDFDIVEASKKVEKITAYIKVSKEALDDISYLNSEIRTELLELINLKLDEQILSGNGTTPNLEGILSYATAFSVAGTDLSLGVDNANNFDVIRAAAWQVMSNNFMPNYVLVNPVDAAVMDLTKATDGHYIMPPFANVNGQVIAGLRVIENNGVTAGTYVVGDFSKSNLGIREDVNIQIGYENDDFTKNLVTILAEMRGVHYIKSNQTGAFVTSTFAAAKALLETA